MEEDLGRLASVLAAGVSDVRACMILSRDGLVLGAHPKSSEVSAKQAWLRFAGIGDPERGFLQFGAETWCYVRRDPYAAFAVVGLGARPGLVIDQMDQVLLVAEQARNKREVTRTEPPASSAPSGKPRTPLHPEPRPREEPVRADGEALVPVIRLQGQTSASPTSSAETGPGPSAETSPGAGASEAPPPTLPPEPDGPPPAPAEKAKDADGSTDKDGESDVDRFTLAREFGQLLQEDKGSADG